VERGLTVLPVDEQLVLRTELRQCLEVFLPERTSVADKR
jgi:hypothetical protein